MSGPEYLQIGVGILNLCVFGLAIPFALRVTRELATITATLEAMSWQEKSISKLQDDVQDIKVRMARGEE